MKIAGLWNSHDCSFCVLEDGVPTIHAELERYTREKEPKGDSFKLFKQVRGEENDIDYWVTCSPADSFKNGSKRCVKVSDKFNHEIYSVGHHQAHAANAFFTSNFEEALIVTIDGGGIDNTNGSLHDKSDIDTVKNSFVTCTTFWSGKGNKINPIHMISNGMLNLGKDWSMCTSKIFGLGTWRDPRGDQAGTVMGMAALGDSEKYGRLGLTPAVQITTS